LRPIVVDWGPKPFRVLDCWFQDRSFRIVVQECWTNNPQRGWGPFVLKEKIKQLKARLKVWSKEYF